MLKRKSISKESHNPIVNSRTSYAINYNNQYTHRLTDVKFERIQKSTEDIKKKEKNVIICKKVLYFFALKGFLKRDRSYCKRDKW